MSVFLRQALALFLAFRIADLINLVAGLYLVPKFVNGNELGAVLPVSTFATTVSIPAFAFAMVFLREGAILSQSGRWGEWKSLVRGVFLATGGLVILGLVVSAVALPPYLRAVGVSDSLVGTLVLTGAFLGAVAPVYSDALNAIQRFRSLGTVEVTAALARLGTLALVMPIRALAGYFAGSVIQPLARITASVFLLRRELAVIAKPYWTGPVFRRLSLLALAVTLYLLTPLLASLAEQSVLRIRLGADDSAAFYLLSRIGGLVDYLTLPLLFALFPRAAQSQNNPLAVRRFVLCCQSATLILALMLAAISLLWGQSPLSWGQTPLSTLPNGEKYAEYAKFLPWIIGIGALNACQIFATNASVAAGRLRFLCWHAPLNIFYSVMITVAPGIVSDLPALLVAMTVLAVLRFLFGQTTMSQPR